MGDGERRRANAQRPTSNGERLAIGNCGFAAKGREGREGREEDEEGKGLRRTGFRGRLGFSPLRQRVRGGRASEGAGRKAK